MALAAALVHCNDGFRLLETSTPKSLQEVSVKHILMLSSVSDTHNFTFVHIKL